MALEKTIEAIGVAIQDELLEYEGEIFKLLDREEKVEIAAKISIEGRPAEIHLTVKLNYTLEKRTILHEEKISERQGDLFLQDKEEK